MPDRPVAPTAPAEPTAPAASAASAASASSAASARRAVPAAVAVAVVLAAAFLLAPPLGTDLSAQVARAGFFDRHGWTPIDLGWYGGISPYGYSPLTPPLMSWLGADDLGPRVTGALALVVSAGALAALLRRTAARRPLLGGVLGAACVAGNLVSGRITYAVGVAFGLLALLALTAAGRRWRRPAAGVAALLAAVASPVAGLFVGLAGVALALSAARSGRARVADGALLAVVAGVPMVATAVLFGAGGWMNISLTDTLRAGAASLAVALLVPRRPVRIGALLATLGVAAAYAVHTPVGLNATRLAAMFALPVIAAYAKTDGFSVIAKDLGRYWGPDPSRSRGTGAVGAGAVLAALLVAVAVCQPPVSIPDLRAAGDPTASRAYFRPLVDELARRAPARVEVVPTGNYWEAAYVPEAAPLARGWLRQADQAYHRLFLDGSVDADSYLEWLRDNGVGYVALAGAEPSWVGRREAELIRAGQPYLTPVWRHPDWTLYEVAGAPSIVAVPARLVAATPARVVLDAPAGDTLVRVRWSRWLRVTGPPGAAAGEAPACLAPLDGWVALHTSRPGRYTITGSLTAGTPC